MLWTELTSEAMRKALKEAKGVCLLPMGCVERHGPHLPLGTDQMAADEICRRAAEIEPAIVFPGYYFGQIAEARHYPGTVALPHDLLLAMLRAVLDEIGRNGFTKILICNGHGGNIGLLDYLMMALLQGPHSYVAYTCFVGQMEKEDADRWAAMKETSEGGHADEGETSVILYLRPELVHLEDLGDPRSGRARRRQKHLGGLRNPLSWYADYPTHLAGDPRPATAEKGKFLTEAAVRKLAKVIRTVKADEVTPRLQAEFHKKAQGHRPARPR